MDRFCPGREMGALVLSTPTLAADNLGHSAWSAEECRKTMAATPGSGFFVCAMTTTMDTTYDDIAQGVRDFGYVGLKPYHFYTKNIEETFEASIMQYVSHEVSALDTTIRAHRSPLASCLSTLSTAPAATRVVAQHCRAANDFGLTISVHMVKKRALSDEENLANIKCRHTLVPPALSEGL